MDDLRALLFEFSEQPLSLMATNIGLEKHTRVMASSFDLAQANALGMLQLRQCLACSEAAHTALQHLHGRLAFKVGLMGEVRFVDASKKLTACVSGSHRTLDEHGCVLTLLLQQLKCSGSLLTSRAELTTSVHGSCCTLDLDRTGALQHAELFSAKALLFLENALLCCTSSTGGHHERAGASSVESADLRLDVDGGLHLRCALSAQEH
jgi:hypothetical protein